MNTDIRLLVSFKGHRKRKRLSLMLGPGATDYLVDLWLTAAEDRPDGRLVDWDEVDIALAANYPGEPEELVQALVKCKWLDLGGDGVFSLHDWEEHNGWACSAKQRSEKAKAAARARWSKKLSEKCQPDAQAMPEHKPSKAPAEQGHAPGNAPPPYPSPSPSPSPDKSKKESAPTGPPKGGSSRPKKINGKHFVNALDGETAVSQVLELGKRVQTLSVERGKDFHVWQWIQLQANEKKHPAAILESLDRLAGYLEGNKVEGKSVFPLAKTIIGSLSPKYCERDHISQAAKFAAELSATPELKGLIAGIGSAL